MIQNFWILCINLFYLHTVCPTSLDTFYTVTYNTNWVKTVQYV